MWSYTLLFPTLLRSLPEQYQAFAQHLLLFGPFDINSLRPEALLGFESFAPLTHGVMWSLGLNIICYIWGSRLYRPSVAEQIQAESFFYYESKPLPSAKSNTHLTDLHQNAARLKVCELLPLDTPTT